MACANVANLLRARANSRRRGSRFERALGASRGPRRAADCSRRVMLLAITGGVLGLGTRVGAERRSRRGDRRSAAAKPVRCMSTERCSDSRRSSRSGPACCSASHRLCGAPARTRATRSRKGIARNTSRQRLLPALVVVEIALGLVLTASAGLLMIRTMSQLWGVNPGFDPQHVLTFGVAGSPAVHGTPAAIRTGLRGDDRSLAIGARRRRRGQRTRSAGCR